MNEHEKITITKYDLLFESRLTKVESIIESVNENMKEIKTDLRWMLGLMLGFSGIILTLMAKGFHWI